MAVVVTTAALLTALRLETGKSDGVALPSPLSLSKPSWVVRTESNIWKENLKKPDPPCVVCKGNGRVDFHHCFGRGRTNHVHLAMLPKDEWPKCSRCRTCGSSGLSYCSHCLGTGEHRYIMGFHFMKMDSSNTQDQKKYQIRSNS